MRIVRATIEAVLSRGNGVEEMKNKGIRSVVAVLLVAFLCTGNLMAQQIPFGGESGAQPDARTFNGGIVGGSAGANPASLEGLLEAIGFILIISGISVAVVLLARKFFPGVIPGTDARMKVLTRLAIGNRQNLVVFRVGDRVLVVAQSSNRVDLLTAISDPEEVQALSYGTDFSREIERVHVETQNEAFPEQSDSNENDSDVRDEIQWLRDRLDGYGDRVEEEVRS